MRAADGRLHRRSAHRALNLTAGRDAEIERERRAVHRFNRQPGAENAGGEGEMEGGRDGGIQRGNEAEEIRVIRRDRVRRAVQRDRPCFAGLYRTGEFHRHIEPVDGRELRAFRNAAEDHSFRRTIARVAEAGVKAGRTADRQDVFGDEIQITFHALRGTIQNRQGVGRAVDARIEARPQSKHRPGMQRMRVRDGHLIAERPKASDCSVDQRVIALAGQRERIVEETFLLYSHAALNGQRPAHGVHALFRRREDQGIAAVHHVIIDGHHTHDVGSRIVPIGLREDHLRRHHHAALAVRRDAVTEQEHRAVAAVDGQRAPARQHVIRIRLRASGNRTLEALNGASQRVTESGGVFEVHSGQVQGPHFALSDLASQFDLHLTPTAHRNGAGDLEAPARFRRDAGIHEERTAIELGDDKAFAIGGSGMGASRIHRINEEEHNLWKSHADGYRHIHIALRGKVRAGESQRPGFVRDD